MNSYFKEKYLSDRDKISKLLEIDDNYTYESFYELMNKDIDINIDSYDTVLLENSSVLLLNLIDKDIDIIVCTLNNYGLNNYIIEKYNEYLKINEKAKKYKVEISKHFNIEDKNIISIGSEAFNKEMNNNYKNIKCINIEI